MTRAEVDLIVDRIDTVHQDLGQRISGVEAQARITNGRVTALEKDRITDEAIRRERAQVLADNVQRARRRTDSWWQRVGLFLAAIAAFGATAGGMAEFLIWLHH